MLAHAFLAVAILLAGCEPTFKPSGALSVRGQAFVPVTCHTLASAVGAFKLEEVQHSIAAAKPAAPVARAPAHVPAAKKPVEKKPVVAKTAHAAVAKTPAHKGNGQLEEGWQEF